MEKANTILEEERTALAIFVKARIVFFAYQKMSEGYSKEESIALTTNHINGILNYLDEGFRVRIWVEKDENDIDNLSWEAYLLGDNKETDINIQEVATATEFIC